MKEEEAAAPQSTAETRNFKLNETDEIDLKTTETLPGNKPTTPHTKPGKAPPGKLPVTANVTKDSGQAASDVLNKFFKRR